MSKTISCRLDSSTHEKLLGKCKASGLTINDFVRVLVESALIESKNASFEANQGFEPTRKSVDQSPDPCLEIDSNLDKLFEKKLNEVLG